MRVGIYYTGCVQGAAKNNPTLKVWLRGYSCSK